MDLCPILLLTRSVHYRTIFGTYLAIFGTYLYLAIFLRRGSKQRHYSSVRNMAAPLAFDLKRSADEMDTTVLRISQSDKRRTTPEVLAALKHVTDFYSLPEAFNLFDEFEILMREHGDKISELYDFKRNPAFTQWLHSIHQDAFKWNWISNMATRPWIKDVHDNFLPFAGITDPPFPLEVAYASIQTFKILIEANEIYGLE